MKNLILAGVSAVALAACGTPESTEPELSVPAPPPAEAPAEAVVEEASAATLKLYTFDCGKIEISDIGLFANDGSYDGQTDTYSDGCFVIQHAEGTLLWDLGLPSALVGQEPNTNGVFTVSVETALSDQIAAAGIETLDYVSISHMHFDHTGQPEAAGGATWLVHETELAAMQAAEDTDYSAFFEMERETFTGDHDVFGDGSVKILEMPGHTPGHTALLVDLENAGPVLLTGDLYHREESREGQKVPVFNTDADETLASMAKFEALAEELGARVIIQHKPADLDALPQPPLALD